MTPTRVSVGALPRRSPKVIVPLFSFVWWGAGAAGSTALHPGVSPLTPRLCFSSCNRNMISCYQTLLSTATCATTVWGLEQIPNLVPVGAVDAITGRGARPPFVHFSVPVKHT